LLAAVAVPALCHDILVRPRHRRSHHAAGGAGRQSSRRRCHAGAFRIGSADLGSIRKLRWEPPARRFRAVVLLPYPRAGTLPVASAELAPAGARRDGVFAADWRAERHPGGGAGGALLGPGGQGVLPARAVVALLLGRVGADPILFGLPGVAALVGLGQRVA